jgi:hypothetical protein
VPSNVTVLPGSPPFATFPITTGVVSAIQNVEIQAAYRGTGVNGYATLQLTRPNPPGAILAVSVSPDNVNFGDRTVVGTVRIAAPVPPQDVAVTLSSSQPNVAALQTPVRRRRRGHRG